MILSGKMDGEKSYICRAKVTNSDLIPGRLGGDKKTCHMAIRKIALFVSFYDARNKTSYISNFT